MRNMTTRFRSDAGSVYRFALALALSGSLVTAAVSAGEPVVGRWNTIDDKTGKVRSTVELYEQGGKVFGRIVGLAEPKDESGTARICSKCTGADKDKPVVGLVILRDLNADGERYKGGTILDPEDGKVYKAEVWTQDGKLRVRGYAGLFFRTQEWAKAK
jgi:uncharacterized protein (DUF2147 family)